MTFRFFFIDGAQLDRVTEFVSEIVIWHSLLKLVQVQDDHVVIERWVPKHVRLCYRDAEVFQEPADAKDAEPAVAAVATALENVE